MNHLIKRVLGWLGVWTALLWLTTYLGRRRQVVVLTYHNVSDPSLSSQALSGLQAGTPKNVFEQQMQVMRRWFHPVNEDELLAIVEGRQTPDRDGFVVTFDDAYQSIQTGAAEVLNRLEITSIIFVATRFVETEHRFWWVHAVDFMSVVTAEQWQALSNNDHELPRCVVNVLRNQNVDDPGRRRQASQALLAAIEQLPCAERMRIAEKLSGVTGASAQSPLPVLGWDQLRELASGRFRIGGHSHTHFRLGQMTRQEVRDDLAQSAGVFKKELGAVPQFFAYPYGDCTDETGKLVAEAGYRMAFTTKPGFLTGRGEDSMRIKRLCLGNRLGNDLLVRLALIKLEKFLPSIVGAWRGRRKQRLNSVEVESSNRQPGTVPGQEASNGELKPIDVT